MIFLLSVPFRLLGIGFRLGAISARLTRGTVRVVGYRRVALVGVGVGVGLLVAPVSGAELRRRLRQRLEDLGRRPPADLADRVREALASSPRTWHLPQPAVSVSAGRVVLVGDVPHATAAADLERTVLAVAGVSEVDNRLTIK
jgi:BON domain